MILSDRSIRKALARHPTMIDPPPADAAFQPASVDLRLGADFLSPYGEHILTVQDGFYTVIPGECVLATTVERIEVPDDMVARVEGKSSWARRFLMVHSTAGFIDPGFHGRLTLELVNLSAVAIALPVGALIAQLSFQWVDMVVDRPYGSPGLDSHYQGQHTVTASVLP